MLGKCLLCGESLEKGATLFELFISHDILCSSCRHQLIKNKKKFKINDIKVDASYIYNDFFSSLLVQYKDCHDEALKPVFMVQRRLIFALKYHGYTIVPLPSSKHKQEERGFNHVLGMFEWCNNPKVCCFEKVGDQKQVHSSTKQRADMVNQIRLTADISSLKKIVLVDDVCTTGSTLKGAISALASYRGKIKIFVVATHELNVKKERCEIKGI